MTVCWFSNIVPHTYFEYFEENIFLEEDLGVMDMKYFQESFMLIHKVICFLYNN